MLHLLTGINYKLVAAAMIRAALASTGGVRQTVKTPQRSHVVRAEFMDRRRAA
jgi:hypothetical protein